MDEKNGGKPARDGAELASGLLLAVATAASAWCAFQSTLWNGEQIRALAAASTAHVQSLRHSNAANTEVMVDVATFLQLVQNEADGDRKVAGYLLKHARPEFRPALAEWQRAVASGDEAAPLPFKSPKYRLAAVAEADELEARAAHAIQVSNYANSKSDLFVLHTVLFALALFFLGTSGQPRARLVQRLMLGAGALLLMLSCISMLRLPRAHHPKLRGEDVSMPEID
jgi:hypothetical protein